MLYRHHILSVVARANTAILRRLAAWVSTAAGDVVPRGFAADRFCSNDRDEFCCSGPDPHKPEWWARVGRAL